MNYNIVSIVADISLALSFIVALVFGIFQVRDAAGIERNVEGLKLFETFNPGSLRSLVAN
jgi:hypothetical protein